MASVGVIGSGTWGTALAILLNGNGHKVQLWSAVPAEVESLSVNRRAALMKAYTEKIPI